LINFFLYFHAQCKFDKWEILHNILLVFAVKIEMYYVYVNWFNGFFRSWSVYVHKYKVITACVEYKGV